MSSSSFTDDITLVPEHRLYPQSGVHQLFPSGPPAIGTKSLLPSSSVPTSHTSPEFTSITDFAHPEQSSPFTETFSWDDGSTPSMSSTPTLGTTGMESGRPCAPMSAPPLRTAAATAATHESLLSMFANNTTGNLGPEREKASQLLSELQQKLLKVVEDFPQPKKVGPTGMLGSPLASVPSPQKNMPPPYGFPTFLTPAVKSSSIEFHLHQHQHQPLGAAAQDLNLPRAFSLEFGLINPDLSGATTPLSIFGNPLEKDPFSREFFPSSHFVDVFGPSHLSPYPATPTNPQQSTTFHILPPALTSTSFHQDGANNHTPLIGEKRKAPPSSLSIESRNSFSPPPPQQASPLANVPILQQPSPRPKKPKQPSAPPPAAVGKAPEPASISPATSTSTSTSTPCSSATTTPAPVEPVVVKAEAPAAPAGGISGHPEFSLLGSRECAHCKTSNTPLWRQGLQGETLCNACGLYLKQHNKPRPLKLTQNPSLPKKKWRIPKGADLFCSNCETRATPIWRRSPDGNLLCNACGLHLRIHNTQRPKVMKTEDFKKRGPPQHKRRRVHSDDHDPSGTGRSSGSEENDSEDFDDENDDDHDDLDRARPTSANAQSGTVHHLKMLHHHHQQQQEEIFRYQNAVIDRAGFVTTSRPPLPDDRYKEDPVGVMAPEGGFVFQQPPQQHSHIQQLQQLQQQHQIMRMMEEEEKALYGASPYQQSCLFGPPFALSHHQQQQQQQQYLPRGQHFLDGSR